MWCSQKTRRPCCVCSLVCACAVCVLCIQRVVCLCVCCVCTCVHAHLSPAGLQAQRLPGKKGQKLQVFNHRRPGLVVAREALHAPHAPCSSGAHVSPNTGHAGADALRPQPPHGLFPGAESGGTRRLSRDCGRLLPVTESQPLMESHTWSPAAKTELESHDSSSTTTTSVSTNDNRLCVSPLHFNPPARPSIHPSASRQNGTSRARRDLGYKVTASSIRGSRL